MTARTLWPSAALVLILVVLAMGYSRSAPVDNQYRPVGYEQRASDLLRSRYTYDPRLEQVRLLDDVTLSRAERRFVAESHLGSDIRRFNSGEKKFIRVRRIQGGDYAIDGVEPGMHNQRLSGQEVFGWNGSLYLRGSPVSRLTGDDLLLEVMQPTWDDLPHMLAQRLEIDLNAPGVKRAVALRLGDGNRQSIAEVKPIGSQVLFELERRMLETDAVRLNGRALPVGWEGFLRHGDEVEIDGATIDGRDLRFESGGEREVVSLIARVNGRVVRHEVIDEPPLPLQVGRAVTNVVSSLSRTGKPLSPASRNTDVQLTFDLYMWRTLQGQLNARLQEAFGPRPLRAGAAVVEARTGRVLALPSYPTAALIDSDDVRPKRDDDTSLLTRNHNLSRKVVGSSVKPFLATAALATRPELAGLQVRCHTTDFSTDRLYGLDFDGSMTLPGIGEDACENGRLDFDGFLVKSSNLYMVSMGVLALAQWDGNRPRTGAAIESEGFDDRFWIGRRAYAARPELRPARWERDRLNDIESERFFALLSRLFDVETRYRAGESLEAYFDTRPGGMDGRGAWDLLFDEFLPDLPEVARELSTVSSERVNVQANLFQHPRQDLYTFFLGQGENRWSNLHLAEALSRLLTGRRTKARFVERLERADGEVRRLSDVLAEEDASDPDLARWAPRVVSAMTETARSGTGRKLGRAVEEINRRISTRCDCRYDVVAKTGTPQQALSELRRGPTEPDPDALVDDRDLVRSSVVIVGLTRTPALPERESLSVAVWIEGQQTSTGDTGVSAVDLAVTLVEPLARTYWPEDFPGDRQ